MAARQDERGRQGDARNLSVTKQILLKRQSSMPTLIEGLRCVVATLLAAIVSMVLAILISGATSHGSTTWIWTAVLTGHSACTPLKALSLGL